MKDIFIFFIEEQNGIGERFEIKNKSVL